MTITLNGSPRQVPDGISISSLLTELKLSADRVAVELNRRLLRSERYGQQLKDGDEVEIVTFVGGG